MSFLRKTPAPARLFRLLMLSILLLRFASSQTASPRAPSVNHSPTKSTPAAEAIFPLIVTSTKALTSEGGGAFSSAKCDADGNLYVRKFALERPLLSPVVKVDRDGNRVARFDPSGVSQVALERAGAFVPTSDGGIDQIAQTAGPDSQIYIVHSGSDGASSSPIHLDANFEPYTFAAFADGNFLVSGVKRDLAKKDDQGKNFTAVFSADGRELAQLSFQDSSLSKKVAPQPQSKPAAADKGATPRSKEAKGEKAPAMLDLAEAESGSDGYLYVMRNSSPAAVYVIASSGKIMQTLKVAAPASGATATGLHVSGNRLAISFWSEKRQSQTIVVVDAQSGKTIAAYSDPGDAGDSFTCYSADDGAFTFLHLGEGNELEVIRAEAQ